jgi:pyruvate dehydrogenase E1 component alpha subunit
MRMHGHGAHDDMSYVPPEMFEEWGKRDPIDRYAERLVADHGFADDEIQALRAEVKGYVDECAKTALDSPMPAGETARDGVFADDITALGDGKAPWSFWSDEGEVAA